MSKATEPQLSAEFIVKRCLKLEQPVTETRLTHELKLLGGMASVDWHGSCELNLRYDASRLQLDQIIELLTQHGVSLQQGRLGKLRLNWYRMTDRNTWDSSRHVPHCCNKSPR